MKPNDAALLPQVSQEEVDARSTIWHRQHVWYIQRTTFRLMFGQVDGLAYPCQSKVSVTTGVGLEDVCLYDEEFPVNTVFPVVASLLMNTRFVHSSAPEQIRRLTMGPIYATSMAPSQLETLHDTIFQRVMDFPDLGDDAVHWLDFPNVAHILRGLIPIDDIHQPSGVRTIVNPFTGQRGISSLQHML